MKIEQTLTSRLRQLEAYIMKQFLNITQRKFIEWLIILSIFIISIPNKWTLMISIALSLLLLKRGAARCRSINHTLYAQIADIHSL